MNLTSLFPVGLTGPQGLTGSAGTSGTSGTIGASGSSGTSGAVGATGTSGSSGTSGAVGATGTSGSSGTSGAVGATGTSGTSGSNGTSGTTGSSGTSGLMPIWTVKTSNYTAVNSDRILADTSVGSFTITLPSSPSAANYIEVNDPEGTWGTNNLTIARNGSNISSSAEDLICNYPATIGLTYVDATIGWKVDFISELGGVNLSSVSSDYVLAAQVFS
jgi:hypothetical protein